MQSNRSQPKEHNKIKKQPSQSYFVTPPPGYKHKYHIMTKVPSLSGENMTTIEDMVRNGSLKTLQPVDGVYPRMCLQNRMISESQQPNYKLNNVQKRNYSISSGKPLVLSNYEIVSGMVNKNIFGNNKLQSGFSRNGMDFQRTQYMSPTVA